MHCKNVYFTEEQVPDRLVKARIRRGRPSGLVKWKVLEIDPMKQILRTEGSMDSLGLHKALHLCRGHFKDYRNSGLFGKVKGVFWWGSSVRGSAAHGTVVKDYSVAIQSGGKA
jgi:hypothetical protein